MLTATQTSYSDTSVELDATKVIHTGLSGASRLAAAAVHLDYEAGMLWKTAEEMASGRAQTRAQRNAIVESFALHTRNLIDFFYGDPRRPTKRRGKDDVVAGHFFSDPYRWQRARPRQSSLLRRAEKRADKEIAHLTYGRLDVEQQEKPWPASDIVADLGAVLDAFGETADLLPDRIKRRLARYRS